MATVSTVERETQSTTIGRTPHPIAARTDFYSAWSAVQSERTYPTTVRARAFALWVGLFGCIDDDFVVTENSYTLAELFDMSRSSWLQYRKLLCEAGLIDEELVNRSSSARSGVSPRSVVKLLPPLHRP